MLITPLLIKHFLPELHQLHGSKVIALRHQPEVKQLILVAKSSVQTSGLLIDYDSRNYHFRLLTDSQIRKLDYPRVDNLLLDLMEATLEKIEQVDFDRILKFHLSKFDQLWGQRQLFLFYEISANSNLILTDLELNILDSLKSTPSDSASARPIRAGARYSLQAHPPQHDPHSLPEPHWKQLLQRHSSENLRHFLTSHFLGLDHFLAEEIMHQSKLSPDLTAGSLTDSDSRRLYSMLIKFFSPTVKIHPALLLDQRNSPLFVSLFVSPFVLTHLPESQQVHFPTLNQALTEFFNLKARQDEFQSRKAGFLQVLENKLSKIETALQKTGSEMQEKLEFQTLKQSGDLIMIHKDTLKKGMSRTTLTDLYSEQGHKVTIPLNPELSPLQNAQNYYKKFQKARTGLRLLEKRKQLLQAELDKTENLRQKVKECRTPQDLENIRPRLVKIGLIRPVTPARSKKKRAEKKLFRQFQTSDGWTVLVGRNNQENDSLTFKTAQPEDFWLHASGMPGSHVVLRREDKKKQPSQQTLIEAASIAAYFSKARHSRKVEVIFTLAKYVRRPQKAKSGLALVEKEKSILVTPKLPDSTKEMSF